MAVARDDLGRDRLRRQAQLGGDVGLDGGVDGGEGADGARDGAGGDLGAGGGEAPAVALELGVKACVNCDNWLLSDIDPVEEHRRALGIPGMTDALLAQCLETGRNAAFLA